ncbi:hypothetical protein [Microbacterium sp. No. 7]|uniref:hypothetical protein n=1 Tax=Microbacterium sp. No. 7 TaxID=1714373 RepID=UPI0006D0C7DB|nr:hypothetical protein [Microbacterium sp. No. 7]ALJ18838.1 hypothetical protein AOA12_02495 [Microbacterium sp. No. 7]
MHRTATRAAALTALALAGALALASCSNAGDGGDTPDDASGVSFGATIEEYRAAFEDVEPITLRMQVDQGPGGEGNKGRIAYAEALEEWSDGKITVEIGEANAFVPDASQWAAAYRDGRLDIGLLLPSYTPEVFPLNSAVSDASIIVGSRPAETLVSSGWMSQVVADDDALVQEFTDEGIHPLVPAMPASSTTILVCSEPGTTLADFSGRSASVSGYGKTAQVQALGMNAVSMPFTDQYEALERGVIDCAATSPQATQAGGLEPLVPYGIADTQVSLTTTSSSFVAGSVWDDLPLVARQLLFDRLDVLLAVDVPAAATRVAQLADALEAAGGGFEEFGADARAVITETNERLLAEIGDTGADVGAFEAARDRWNGIVFDELGVYDGPDVRAFVAQVDAARWADALLETALQPLRPE